MTCNVRLGILLSLLTMAGSAREAFAEAQEPDSHPAATFAYSPGGDGAPGRDQTMPEGLHIETEPRKPVLRAGAFTFGVPYTLSVALGVALLSLGHDVDPSFHSWWLLVPVAGPFAVLPATKHTGDFTIFLVDGLAQAAGVAMIVSAIIWPRTLVVRKQGARIALSPMRLGADGNGIGVMGSF